MTDIAKLRNDLAKAIRENRLTDASVAWIALHAAGAPEAELDRSALVILKLAASKAERNPVLGNS